MALGSRMRSLLLLPCVFLAACASTPSSDTSSSHRKLDLPEMAAGECGIFGWTTDEKRSFVFYADPDGAKFAPNGEVVKLAAVDPFPSLSYTDPEGGPVSLKLGQGEIMVGGMRYPYARILTKTEDGWDRFMPVAIVRSCQTS